MYTASNRSCIAVHVRHGDACYQWHRQRRCVPFGEYLKAARRISDAADCGNDGIDEPSRAFTCLYVLTDDPTLPHRFGSAVSTFRTTFGAAAATKHSLSQLVSLPWPGASANGPQTPTPQMAPVGPL